MDLLSPMKTFVRVVEAGSFTAVAAEVNDPTLIAKRVGVVRRVTVASPNYLKKRPAPQLPADLAEHECIVYTRLATGNRWLFEGPNGPLMVEVNGRLRADDSEAVREAVLGGLGVAVIPTFAFFREFELEPSRFC